MKPMNDFLFEQIIEAFDETYRSYRTEHRLPDTSVVRAGFYTVCIEMVGRLPMPEKSVQSRVFEYLEMMQEHAFEEGVVEIERKFDQIGERQQQERLNSGVRIIPLVG